MSLTLRNTKGSALTYAEADANFSGLADLSLTSFLPSGTGAVARTVQSHLRDLPTLSDYDTQAHYLAQVATLITSPPLSPDLVDNLHLLTDINTIAAVGDSITNYTGSSDNAHAFIGLIGTATGWSFTNYGASSVEIQDLVINQVYPRQVAENSAFTTLLGFNDMRHQGTSATGQATYAAAMKACLAWLAIPHANKLQGGGSSVTRTGSWTTLPLYNGALSSAYSSTINDTMTCTVYGTAVYIGYANRTGLGGGTFSVTIDSVLYGSVDESVGVLPISGTTFWPSLFRVGGLSNGPHAVSIKITSALATNIDWIASNENMGRPASPKVFAGNTLRMNSTGYALSAGTFNNGSDAVVAAFNAINLKAVNELASDGLSVYYIDASRAYNPNLSADGSGDNIHPGDQGHAKIAQAFLSAINNDAKPLPLPIGRAKSYQGNAIASANNLSLGTDGNYFQITGATQINLLDNANWQGQVTLKFNSTPTVKNNQGASGNFKPVILNGAVDFVAAASNTLTLFYDSTDAVWYEIGRKV